MLTNPLIAWLSLGLSALWLIVVPFVLFAIKAMIAQSELRHNLDPGAHPNHGLSRDLELKFDKLIEELQRVRESLAILTERIAVGVRNPRKQK